MTEAPERIWAYAGAFRMWREKYPEHVKSPVEYIRADRIEALKRQVKAADALAEAHLTIVETTEGLPGTIIQECRQISRKVLAAYHATKEGGA